MENFTIGAQLIADERKKQIEKYGFTAEHHVNHPEQYENNQLKKATVSILFPETIHAEIPENWDKEWFTNLMNRSNKERLIIAGALIAAEIDRITELEKQ